MDVAAAEAGARMMAGSEPWLTLGRSFEKSFLCVSSFNPAARRLCERLGYAVVGTLDDDNRARPRRGADAQEARVLAGVDGRSVTFRLRTTHLVRGASCA